MCGVRCAVCGVRCAVRRAVAVLCCAAQPIAGVCVALAAACEVCAVCAVGAVCRVRASSTCDRVACRWADRGFHTHLHTFTLPLEFTHTHTHARTHTHTHAYTHAHFHVHAHTPTPTSARALVLAWPLATAMRRPSRFRSAGWPQAGSRRRWRCVA